MQVMSLTKQTQSKSNSQHSQGLKNNHQIFPKIKDQQNCKTNFKIGMIKKIPSKAIIIILRAIV